jgi:hypothetical protein
MRLAGAVDIGATNTKIGIVGEDGRIFRRTTIPTKSGSEPRHLVDAIAAELRPMLDAVTDERNQVVAIGIAIAGFLDREHTMMIANANLRDLCEFPLRRAFEERFELDCHLEVDSNATTMAEYRFGMGRGTTNLLEWFSVREWGAESSSEAGCCDLPASVWATSDTSLSSPAGASAHAERADAWKQSPAPPLCRNALMASRCAT